MTPQPRSVLKDVLRPGRVGAENKSDMTVAERPLAIVQVQARSGQEAALAEALASAFQLVLPVSGRVTSAGELTAAWIEPGTWLVLAQLAATGDLERRMRAAAGGLASVTDQTFGKSVLRLSGERARDVLAKGCRVDLHPRVFGPGRAAVTPVAHIGCVVLQVDSTPTFDLVVPSTLAQSFVDWVLLSAAEFGCEIRGPAD